MIRSKKELEGLDRPYGWEPLTAASAFGNEFDHRYDPTGHLLILGKP